MKQKGFTLIELLVVISIVSLLSTIVFSAVNAAREKARIAAGMQLDANIKHGIGDQLVGEWLFEDASCKASLGCLDTSGFNNTLTGGFASCPGVMGFIGFDGKSDCSFNGVTNGIYPASLAITTNSVDNWTITAWINPKNIPTTSGLTRAIVGNGSASDGYVFAIGDCAGGAGSKLCGYYPSGVGWFDSGYTFPSAGKWYFVVISRSAGATNFYVDGKKTSNTYLGAPIAPTANIWIGEMSGGSYKFEGSMDNIHIYTSGF